MGLGLVAVCTHLLRILVPVFADSSASFHTMVGSLWLRFVVDLSGVDEHFLSGGDLHVINFCLYFVLQQGCRSSNPVLHVFIF